MVVVVIVVVVVVVVEVEVEVDVEVEVEVVVVVVEVVVVVVAAVVVAQLLHVTATLSLSRANVFCIVVCAQLSSGPIVFVLRVGLWKLTACAAASCVSFLCFLLCAAAMPLEQPQLLVPKELAFPEEAKLPDAMSQWSLDAGVRLSAWSGLRGKPGHRHCPCQLLTRSRKFCPRR